jgi:hypothetical protein
MELCRLNLDRPLESKRLSSHHNLPVWERSRPLGNFWNTDFAHVWLGVSSPASMSRLGTTLDRPIQPE